MNSILRNFRAELLKQANPQTKLWWENYVKGSAPFIGVAMGDVRKLLHNVYEAKISKRLSIIEQKSLALAFLAQRYTEEKLAGIILLQEILIPQNIISPEKDLISLKELFISQFIYDWNICDWFSVKVLSTLLKKHGMSFARKLTHWRHEDNLWCARASLVPFIGVAEDPKYRPLIKSGCRSLIRREERFAKTAVGWVLREVSKTDQEFVKVVISENKVHFSRESLINATKYFPKQKRVALLSLVQAAS